MPLSNKQLYQKAGTALIDKLIRFYIFSMKDKLENLDSKPGKLFVREHIQMHEDLLKVLSEEMLPSGNTEYRQAVQNLQKLETYEN